MINLFEKSRKIKKNGVFAAIIISLAFASYIFFIFGFTLRLISAVVLFMLLTGSIYFIALFSAVNQHQKLLTILYNQVDPERFITAYTPLLSRCGLSRLMILTLKAHLGNAYANLGNVKEALRLLEDADIPKGRQSANASLLVAGNRLSYYLLGEDLDKSKKACEELDRLILKYREENVSISNSFIRNQRLQHVNLNLLLGKLLDESPLYQELRTSTNRLHLVNVQYLLGKIYLTKKNEDAATSYLKSAAKYPNIISGKNATALLTKIMNT